MIQEKNVYRKTLETYEKEMRPLLEKLPVYLEEDKELFRIKIHGLKGASRQIGKKKISEYAERMELAVKKEDQPFLQAHMDLFLQKLEEALDEVVEELAHMPKPRKVIPEEKYSVEKLFLELKNGFDSYNLEQIERALELLEEQNLEETQASLLKMAQEACDELEYEKGSELLREAVHPVRGGNE